jgi:hypothetical protein
MVVTVLAIGWSLLAATPFVRRARRERTAARLREVVPPLPAPAHRARSLPRPIAVVMAVITSPWRRRAARARDNIVRHQLPVAVDLLTVAIGAGCTPYGAVEIAAAWCPPEVGGVLAAVPRDCSRGATFEVALHDAARRTPAIGALGDALSAASRLGAPIAPTLARLAAEGRADMRRAAEARARTVPVRLLFPLVFLVLPAFGLLTVVPVLIDGFSRAR